MAQLQQSAVHNHTAAMLEMGTNLLSQTAEQTRKLTDVETQVRALPLPLPNALKGRCGAGVGRSLLYQKYRNVNTASVCTSAFCSLVIQCMFQKCLLHFSANNCWFASRHQVGCCNATPFIDLIPANPETARVITIHYMRTWQKIKSTKTMLWLQQCSFGLLISKYKLVLIKKKLFTLKPLAVSIVQSFPSLILTTFSAPFALSFIHLWLTFSVLQKEPLTQVHNWAK